MTRRRPGGRLRSCIVVAAALILLPAPSHADRLLHFSVTPATIDDVATAAINGDGMVVMRLRSKNAEGLLRKAEVVASRLTELALGGLKPGQVVVERLDGEWAVVGRGELIVTADADTVNASGQTAQALCEGWRARIAEVLAEAYLCVEPDDLLIVPHGETRDIRFGGTIAAAPTVESMSPAVASAERRDGRVVVRGVKTGTTVVVVEVGKARAAVTIDVKKWAARIAGSASLTKLSGGLPEPMREVALLNAALSAVAAEPRANIDIMNLAASATGYSVSLRAGGEEYLPVTKHVQIGVREAPSGLRGTRALLVSNYPEKVTGRGALMRQRLDRGVPTRLMWHHKNHAGRPMVATVRLVNAGSEPARISVGWSQAGPNPDEIYVGYNAMLRYWETVRRGAGFVANVPPATAFETSAMRMGHHDVVSGLMDLMAEAGEHLYVEMLARDPADAPHGYSRISPTAAELALTPYHFPATIEAEMDYEVGGRFEHLSIGREDVVNDQGFALAGAYGVSHLITVNASNPTEAPATLELALRAGGGVARTVAIIDGVINTSGILSAGHEQILERRPLPPGVSRKLELEIIPTAGSNLPFTLVVRSRNC
ncbi:MAG: hypothetical protein ACLFU7_09595 [Armatimonadota bacterium]